MYSYGRIFQVQPALKNEGMTQANQANQATQANQANQATQSNQAN